MPPLWKIKNESFWLAGTLHLMEEKDYPISDILQEAINIANLLVLEDKDFLVKGQNFGLYQEGRSIHSELSPEAINLLLERCKNLGLDFKAIQTYRPWKAAIVVLGALGKSIGFSIDYSLDKYLLDTFLSSEKQVASLEDSATKLLLVLESLSREDQEKMLIKTIENIELTMKGIEDIHEAWKSGSQELVIKLAHEPLKIYPNLFQQLILERNISWLPKIKKLIGQRISTLVAVGAGHLFGESNIIDQLITTGYNIERLT